MSPNVCLDAVLKIKVTTPARNGIRVILWAPGPYIHCTTLPRPYTECTILHCVLSVHTHQASCWSLIIELLWVISYTWSTGAQPLVFYPGVLCVVTCCLCNSSPCTDFNNCWLGSLIKCFNVPVFIKVEQ